MERLEELKNKFCKEIDEYAGLKQFDRNAIEHIDKLLASVHHINKIMDHDNGLYNRGYGNWRPENMSGYGNDYYARDYMTYGPRYGMDQYNTSPQYSHGRTSLVEKLEMLKQDAPDEMSRNEIQKLIMKMQ